MYFSRDFRIKTYGPEMINRLSKPILEEDFPDLQRLRDYMVKVMRLSNGVGLAAPQIGLFKRFVVFEKPNGDVVDLVNPQIVRLYGKESEGLEGCLSLPPSGNECPVPRMQIVEVESATVSDPNNYRKIRFAKLSARIVQHEVDHLDGTFFIDRVADKQRRLVLEKFELWKLRRRAQTRIGGKNAVTGTITTVGR